MGRPDSTAPWPQDRETMVGEEESCPTLPFDGDAEQVATLYS